LAEVPTKNNILTSIGTVLCHVTLCYASVCSFVCLSVTSRSIIKTAKRVIKQTIHHNGLGAIAFWHQTA